MKRFILIGLAFAVLGVVMSNVMLGKKPTDAIPDVSNLKDIEMPSVFSRVTDVLSGSKPGSVGGSVDEPVSVYRWQDADGNWHFDDAPPEGLAAEEVVIEVDNVLEMELPQLPDRPSSSTASDVELGSPYSPQGVKDLMDKAGDVQGTLDDRAAEQQRALDSL